MSATTGNCINCGGSQAHHRNDYPPNQCWCPSCLGKDSAERCLEFTPKPPMPPKPPILDSPKSEDPAKPSKPKDGTVRRTVYDAIAASGARGTTDADLAVVLDKTASAISRARKALGDADLIVEVDPPAAEQEKKGPARKYWAVADETDRAVLPEESPEALEDAPLFEASPGLEEEPPVPQDAPEDAPEAAEVAEDTPEAEPVPAREGAEAPEGDDPWGVAPEDEDPWGTPETPEDPEDGAASPEPAAATAPDDGRDRHPQDVDTEDDADPTEDEDAEGAEEEPAPTDAEGAPSTADAGTSPESAAEAENVPDTTQDAPEDGDYYVVTPAPDGVNIRDGATSVRVHTGPDARIVITRSATAITLPGHEHLPAIQVLEDPFSSPEEVYQSLETVYQAARDAGLALVGASYDHPW